MTSRTVFDASALLALLYEEKGADKVLRRISHACISTVNLTEVASRMIHKGEPQEEVLPRLQALDIAIVEYDETQALLAAKLYSKTRSKGLSLADRACLALAITHKLPVLTADKAWASLKLGVKIETIR